MINNPMDRDPEKAMFDCRTFPPHDQERLIFPLNAVGCQLGFSRSYSYDPFLSEGKISKAEFNSIFFEKFPPLLSSYQCSQWYPICFLLLLGIVTFAIIGVMGSTNDLHGIGLLVGGFLVFYTLIFLWICSTNRSFKEKVTVVLNAENLNSQKKGITWELETGCCDRVKWVVMKKSANQQYIAPPYMTA